MSSIQNERSLSSTQTQELLMQQGKDAVELYMNTNSDPSFLRLILIGYALEENSRDLPADQPSFEWAEGAKTLLGKYARGAESARIFKDEHIVLRNESFVDMMQTLAPQREAWILQGRDFAQAVALGQIAMSRESVYGQEAN